VQIYKLKFYIHYEYIEGSEMGSKFWPEHAHQKIQYLVASEAAYQRLRHQKLCLITSGSDTCSKGRFVRRTFSATMIEFHHPLTIQKLENQPYPQNSNVSTIVRTFYLNWTNLHFQVWSYTKVTRYGSKIVLLPAGEISCNEFKFKTLHPLL
jgi:hypothetical protein